MERTGDRTGAAVDREDRARALLAELSTDEKLGLLDGDTPFWSGMADIALRDASHRHPWPAGRLPRLGLGGLHFVDGPRGVVLHGGATRLDDWSFRVIDEAGIVTTSKELSTCMPGVGSGKPRISCRLQTSSSAALP